MKVVVLVNNPATHDTRVIKESESLAAAGYDVVVVGRAAAGVPSSEVRAGVRYLRPETIYFNFLNSVLTKGFVLKSVIHRTYVRGAMIGLVLSPLLAPLAVASVAYRSIELVARRWKAQREALTISSPSSSSMAQSVDSREGDGSSATERAPAGVRPVLQAPEGRAFRVSTILRFLYVHASSSCQRIVNVARRVYLGALYKSLLPLVIADDYERAALSAILAERPDVVHSNDLDTLPTAIAAKAALNCLIVYDAHELETDRNDRSAPLVRYFAAQMERECLAFVSRCVTVSPGIARHMANEYGIPEPVVVLNAPVVAPPSGSARDSIGAPVGGGLRERLGLSIDRPLVVYVGLVTIDRCLPEMVRALLDAPEFSLAMVGPQNREVASLLMSEASRLGVADRFFLLPPVPPMDVTLFVASADVGTITAPRLCLSYEYSMPNKLFEMSLAGLPLVVADLQAMREFVESNGIGIAVDSTAPEQIARGWQTVYQQRSIYRPSPAKLRQLIEQYSWQTQAARLTDLYDGLMHERSRSMKRSSCDLLSASDPERH